jgi:hypothetical protein
MIGRKSFHRKLVTETLPRLPIFHPAHLLSAPMNPHHPILDLKERISAAVIGQDAVVEQLLIALLANGHLLSEGLPGLAKTRTPLFHENVGIRF